ncbi:efflux RND transporter periplasmic adaptor subunit [Xylophilus sp. Leaf220]|uniref:efflux RND transporter periplasmic adaptor subunit n=1 Tax=Xylophilus sp. Leaf220 TaxID=1735686 RepID=UPI0006FF0961|nr:HlyD family efflux transporter periplasmic adaptor subunit [Xylophilus sp. Leaf220]KQM75616.1 hypothetical protein ASE76_06770 [Xylophilus sp. Leaf220]
MTRFILFPLLALGLLAGGASPARADAGHSHDAAPSIANGDGPRRLPDGTVFLPKSSQRPLQLRTTLAERRQLPRTVELNGRVMADPSAGGKVQPTVPGRIEASPRGLPRLGQAVARGEVLAVVRSSAAPLEAANQVALAAELRANLGVARSRVARLEQLEGTVPQKDIEAARAEAAGLGQRLAAVGAGVGAQETLRAPVAGVVAAIDVVAGQVVDARDTLFEIVDPARLIVEARAFDASLAARVAGAQVLAVTDTGPGTPIPLVFSGAGRMLREGAIPLQFRTAGNAEVPLAVGQPVRLSVQTTERVEGFALPASALVRSAANQDTVWVQAAAEHFVPRTVRQVPLDGATIAVLEGLRPGDRVVTQAAPLLNQVR